VLVIAADEANSLKLSRDHDLGFEREQRLQLIWHLQYVPKNPWVQFIDRKERGGYKSYHDNEMLHLHELMAHFLHRMGESWLQIRNSDQIHSVVFSFHNFPGMTMGRQTCTNSWQRDVRAPVVEDNFHSCYSDCSSLNCDMAQANLIMHISFDS